MSKKECHALVYETKTGELRLVVFDIMGNIRYAAPVPPEHVLPMLNDLQDCWMWEMPAHIINPRQWWNETAVTPGTKLIYCRRHPVWDDMREAGYRAFAKLEPAAAYLPKSFIGKDILVLTGTIKNKETRRRILEAVRNDFDAVELGTSPALTFKLKSREDFSRLMSTIRESKNDGREFCRVVVVGCEVFKVR